MTPNIDRVIIREIDFGRSKDDQRISTDGMEALSTLGPLVHCGQSQPRIR